MSLWLITDKGDPDALALVDGTSIGGGPHYSRQTPGARQFTRNGQNLVFITACKRAVWVTFRPTPGKATRPDGLDCWENALFRNEGAGKSSDLIREAVLLSSALWGEQPKDGFVTFIDPAKVRSGQSGKIVGYCYRRAGWKRWGQSKDGKPRFRAPRVAVVDHTVWGWHGTRGGRLRETLEAGGTLLDVGQQEVRELPSSSGVHAPAGCLRGEGQEPRSDVPVEAGARGEPPRSSPQGVGSMRPPIFEIFVGDVRAELAKFPEESVHMACSSFPYWSLRSYGKGHPGQIGLEPTFEAWIETCVDVSRGIRRVLRRDGTFWLNIGQSYAGARSFQGSSKGTDGVFDRRAKRLQEDEETPAEGDDAFARRDMRQGGLGHKLAQGFKNKDLIMQGPLLAEALRRDGWVLRSHIIWTKNAMPESVTDRPAVNFEHVFEFARSNETQFWTHESGLGTRAKPAPDYVWWDEARQEDISYEPAGWKQKEKWNGEPRFKRRNRWRGHDYFYDANAVREPDKGNDHSRNTVRDDEDRSDGLLGADKGIRTAEGRQGQGANLRAVWMISNEPFPADHFATWPTALAQMFVKAGTSEGGCCTLCGAPWWPLVKEGEADEEWKRECGADANGSYNGTSTKSHDEDGVQDASAVKARILAGMKIRNVERWFPTCEHKDAAPQPCLVLDPFSGSGRAGKAALAMGRDYAGIELVPAYAEMSIANLSDPEWESKERKRRRALKDNERPSGDEQDAAFAAGLTEGSQD